MGTRFIHKGGRIIPIHSDHGDQPQSSGEHSAPKNPPATPAPTKPDAPHPEARKQGYDTAPTVAANAGLGALAGAGMAGPVGAAVGSVVGGAVGYKTAKDSQKPRKPRGSSV